MTDAPRGVILVVDDDPLVARLVVRLLALVGFAAHEARTLAAAREALAAGGFAAVFLDNALADGNGLEFAAAAQAAGAPPIVMMSGAPDVLAEARARLGLATLDKPMDKEKVRAALRQVGLEPA